MKRIVLALMCSALPGGSASQTLALDRPIASLPSAFSQVRGVRELPSGRLLVADWIEERLVIVNLLDGSVVLSAGPGSGPEEIRLPSSLIPYPGDSTLVADQANNRFSVVDPEGRIRRTFPATRPGVLGARGADAHGRLLHAIPAWAEQEPLAGDSVRLALWDPRNDRVEILTHALGARRRTDQSPTREIRIPVVGFAPQDDWVVDPDIGTPTVVRSRPYRLEQIAPDDIVRGPPVDAARRPVTNEEKLAFVARFLESSPMSGRGTDGTMGHAPSMSSAGLSRLVATTEFAEVHPPFEPGSARPGPGRHIWVARATPSAEARVYDVFGATGEPELQVRLPPGRRVLAVTERGVYAVVRDDLGLEALELYALPRYPASFTSRGSS